MHRALAASRRLIRNLRSLPADARGAMAVEFALVLPVALLALLGFLQVGTLMFDRNTLQYATEQAGRYAMAHTAVTSQQITDVVKAQAAGLDSSRLAVKVVQTTSNGATFINITSNYTFTFLMGILPFGTVNLTGQSNVPLGT